MNWISYFPGSIMNIYIHENFSLYNIQLDNQQLDHVYYQNVQDVLVYSVAHDVISDVHT